MKTAITILFALLVAPSYAIHRGNDDAAATRPTPFMREEEEEEDLLDLRIYSSSSFALSDDQQDSSLSLVRRTTNNIHAFPYKLRLPESFDDNTLFAQPTTTIITNNNNIMPLILASPPPPLNEEWNQESVANLEQRLTQTFGSNFKKTKHNLLKTGTTIAGVCGLDDASGAPFVVLGADTRATAGRMVADKKCQKIHCLARNIWCCGAGTSADLDHLTRQCRYSLALTSLMENESIGNAPRQWLSKDEPDLSSSLESTAQHTATVAAACRLLRNVLYSNRGSVGANLILGGVDESTGIPHIRAIHPHGSMDDLPYAALGSGGLAAMAVIESRYRSDITLQQGIEIVKEAILSGIQNDMGSGSQVDLCIITTTNNQQTLEANGHDEQEKPGSSVRVFSNYMRAVVPEQELPARTKSVDTITAGDKSTSTPGANGFGGKQPYSIRSSTVILPSLESREKETRGKWDQLLGLPEEATAN